MRFGASVHFNGNCRQAVTFYTGVFKQPTPYFITYGVGDTSFDPHVKQSDLGKNLVMFTSLTIAGAEVIFSDMAEDVKLVRGNGMELNVTCDTLQEADEIFAGLGQGGQVFVPLAEVRSENSYDGYYGMLADPFGILWSIRVTREQDS